MQITIVTSHGRTLSTTKYSNTMQALRHAALPLAQGRPFTMKVHHNGQTQVNQYDATGTWQGRTQ